MKWIKFDKEEQFGEKVKVVEMECFIQVQTYKNGELISVQNTYKPFPNGRITKIEAQNYMSIDGEKI